MKPIIGLFISIANDGTHTLFKEYIEALEGAGAQPILLPYTEGCENLDRLVEICDGFCFTGGVDVAPCYYGEAMLPECGEIQDRRDSFEMMAIPKVIASGKPILGICRGAQVINVALGGSLYQDIPSQLSTAIDHRQSAGRYEPWHFATVTPDTPLAILVGEDKISVNSFHHQAIKRLGDGLRAMATSEDGIIEAAYRDGEQYIRLYQWHPERLIESDRHERAIFTDFVTAAISNKDNK